LQIILKNDFHAENDITILINSWEKKLFVLEGREKYSL